MPVKTESFELSDLISKILGQSPLARATARVNESEDSEIEANYYWVEKNSIAMVANYLYEQESENLIQDLVIFDTSNPKTPAQ